MTNRGELIASIEAKSLEELNKKKDDDKKKASDEQKQQEEQKQQQPEKGKKKKKSKKADERYDFVIGDTVKVWVKIVEGTGKKERERLQGFEGIAIAINGSGGKKSFTVRKISFGVGVERVFPFKSPLIGRVEIVRRGKVRRAKLYYLRNRVGKAAQVKRKEFVGAKKKKAQ